MSKKSQRKFTKKSKLSHFCTFLQLIYFIAPSCTCSDRKRGKNVQKKKTFLLTHYCLKGPPHNPESGTQKITKNPNSLIGLLSWAHLLCSTQLHLFQDKKEQKSSQEKTFLLRHYSNSGQAMHSKLGTQKITKNTKAHFSPLSWLNLLCSIRMHLFQEKKEEKRPKGTVFLLSHY